MEESLEKRRIRALIRQIRSLIAQRKAEAQEQIKHGTPLQRSDGQKMLKKAKIAGVQAALEIRSDFELKEGKKKPSIPPNIFTNFLKGNTDSIPSKAVLEWLADFLKCSEVERERLFRIAGYVPMLMAPRPDVSPEARAELKRRLRLSQFPAFAVDQVWDVIDANANFCRLMGVPDDYLMRIPPRKRNQLLLIFDNEFAFRRRLTTDEGSWEEIAEANLRVFRLHNFELEDQAWYQNRVLELCSFSVDLQKAWDEVDIFSSFSPRFATSSSAGLATSYRVPLNTVGHPIRESPTGVVNLAPSSNTLTELRYPCIFFYVPLDEEAEQWFKDIGIGPPA